MTDKIPLLPQVPFMVNITGNKPSLDIGLLKIIKLIIIIDQVKLSTG